MTREQAGREIAAAMAVMEAAKGAIEGAQARLVAVGQRLATEADRVWFAEAVIAGLDALIEVCPACGEIHERAVH